MPLLNTKIHHPVKDLVAIQRLPLIVNWARIRKTGAFVHYLGGQNVQTGADVPPTDQMFGCDAAAATPAAKQRPVRYFLTLSGRAFVTLQATKQRLHNCLIEGEWQSLLIHCPSGNG
jgi:hypothetical protein